MGCERHTADAIDELFGRHERPFDSSDGRYKTAMEGKGGWLA